MSRVGRTTEETPTIKRTGLRNMLGPIVRSRAEGQKMTVKLRETQRRRKWLREKKVLNRRYRARLDKHADKLQDHTKTVKTMSTEALGSVEVARSLIRESKVNMPPGTKQNLKTAANSLKNLLTAVDNLSRQVGNVKTLASKYMIPNDELDRLDKEIGNVQRVAGAYVEMSNELTDVGQVYAQINFNEHNRFYVEPPAIPGKQTFSVFTAYDPPYDRDDVTEIASQTRR